ncbi:O-antigen ligase family protein [Mycobacterium sp. NPDC048908]|uniref:O-antigen ligase family protein n=1 Tax=Mycobacterium sp. NPDC048908 TaxID=3364292 RepID=UPI0037191D8B
MSASTDRPTAPGRHRVHPENGGAPPAADSKRGWPLVVLVGAVVAMSILPDLVHFMNVERDPTVIDFARYPLARNISVVAAVALFLTCFAVIFWRGRSRGNVAGLISILVALLVPVAIHPASPDKADVVKIALAVVVIVAVWKVGAPVEMLKWVAVSGSLIAIYSLIGAVTAPEHINYRTDSEKAFIGNLQLAGPFVHSNALALYCVLALALVPLIVSIRWRICNGLILILAIVASASRTALLAVAILALWWIFCRFRSRLPLRLVGSAMVAVCAAIALTLPLLSWSPSAFSGRGYAWTATLQAWQVSRLVGLGPDWFTTTTASWERPGSWAFRSGHNLVIDTLAKSGLVGICLLALVLLCATCAACVLDIPHQQIACFGYLIAFLIEASTETTWFLLPSMSLFPVVGLVFAVLIAGSGTSGRGNIRSLSKLDPRRRTKSPVRESND